MTLSLLVELLRPVGNSADTVGVPVLAEVAISDGLISVESASVAETVRDDDGHEMFAEGARIELTDADQADVERAYFAMLKDGKEYDADFELSFDPVPAFEFDSFPEIEFDQRPTVAKTN